MDKKQKNNNKSHKEKNNRCFQYVLTVALNHENIGGHTERTTKIKPFNPITKNPTHPLTIFSPVTSTNVGIGPTFLTFIVKPFATLVQNFKFVPSANPKLLNLNQDRPSKKAVFLVKSS